MAEWSMHWTHNPPVPGLIPSLATCWIILFLVRPEFKSSAMLVSSQLVCLLPVGIITHIMFYLNYCFIIPEKPHKGSG